MLTFLDYSCKSLYSKFLLLFILTLTSLAFGQKNYLFYHPEKIGSEQTFNPINLILNSSYDIIQLDGHERQIFRMNYYAGIKNVSDNLLHPFSSIEKYGWWKFIKTELLPIELTKKGAQWWPNYQLHLIGGGMTYVKMREWYDYHNIPYPALFSAITIMGEHFLNEVVENSTRQGLNVDAISDIYFFDIGGIILFSFDDVARFFAEDLNLNDWSLQPSFTFPGAFLNNNGQYFSIKWKLPFSQKLHLFYYFGMNGLTGLSYKFNSSDAISIGAGLRAKKLKSVNGDIWQNTVDMVWNAGVFYDRDNSLLASVFFSGLTDYACNINIYPGLIKIGPISPGLWTVFRKNGDMMFGFTTIYAPGIGFE